MKTLNLLAITVLASVMIALSSCGNKGGNSTKEMNAVSSFSYAFGAQLGTTIQNMGLSDTEKDPDKFIEGFQVGLSGDSAAFAMSQQTLIQRTQSQTPSPTPEAGKEIAYAMGIASIGGLAVMVDVPASDFDLDALRNGFVAKTTNDSILFTQPEIDSMVTAYFKPKSEEYKAVMEAKQKEQAAVAIEAGEKFLEENGKREGVITTESGLQYEVITEGNGPKPTMADKVKTHYHGTLVDGTIFDSSVDRGEPATFPVGGVIKGWQEGIPLMSVGSKYRFFIPQELAYGMRAPSPKIPAGSALIFEVELFEINPAE